MNKPLLNEQDKVLGGLYCDRLNRRSHKVVDGTYTPNNIYWLKLPFGLGGRGISMVNLRYVDYVDTYFYIKPFKKG